MTREQALDILGDTLKQDGGLYCLGHYMAWTPGDDTATLDSQFTADELEAIVVIMRSTPPTSTTGGRE
jgi:hypothetical protein